MQKSTWIIATTTLAAAVSLNAAAEEGRPSGNSFLVNCKVAERIADGENVSDAWKAMKCIDYLAGFRDAMALSTENGWNICVPHEVTIGQLVRTYVKWASDHPQHLHEDASFTVALALSKTFPCNSKNQ